MKLIFKGDLDKVRASTDLFELYVRNSKDLDETFNNVIALHFHYKLDDGRTINLADPGELGDLSEAMLKKAVECARRNKVKKIVFHPPYVDLTKTSKEEAIKIMARRLENVHHSEVLLCIENVCLWVCQAHINEPLFVEPDDYFKIVNETKVPLGLTIDIEHFCFTAIMKIFYAKYKNDLLEVNKGNLDYKEVETKFERELAEYIQNNDLHQICHNYVTEAINKLDQKISHLHICGSDFTQYFCNPVNYSPFIGEHLPINFSGNLHGRYVEDKINHSLWINLLKEKNLDIVMEVPHHSMQDSKEYLLSLK